MKLDFDIMYLADVATCIVIVLRIGTAMYQRWGLKFHCRKNKITPRKL